MINRSAARLSLQSAPSMIHDPWFYIAAIPAMIILGVSKGGFTVIGILAVPILAIVISPVQAAGITLPILVLSDIVAIITYRRLYDLGVLKVILPGALLGILIGWLTAAWVTEHQIRLIVGLVSVLFALDYWFRAKKRVDPHPPNTAKGLFWGTVTGFTSFVSHAGGTPYQIYVAPLRLEPLVFAGTTVIVFAVINAVKLVPYFFLGQFDSENLLTAAIISPIALVSVLLGIWLVKNIDPKAYYDLVYALIFLVGLFLVWEGVAALV
jgi:uncharacterized membrane protein YfcA